MIIKINYDIISDMKKFYFLLALSILLFSSCSMKKTQDNILSGKIYELKNQWGQTETYTFNRDGTASLTIQIITEGNDYYKLVTFFDYSIDEENETLNLKILKYPYLQDDDTYKSLTYSELIEIDPEGKEAYDDVFSKTIVYKYLLLPTKLYLSTENSKQEYKFVKIFKGLRITY